MGGATDQKSAYTFLRNMFKDVAILPIKNFVLRSLISIWIAKTRYKSFANRAMAIGGSPILRRTEKLAEKIAALSGAKVLIAMRYTEPFATDAITEIKKRNIDRVILLPLYPQYSFTTTKSSLYDFYLHAEKLNLTIKIIKIKEFYKERKYNDLIVNNLMEILRGKNPKEFALIFSAHSLPQKVIDRGDPYQKQCEDHAKILSEIFTERSLNFASIKIAYQSKFGRKKWLEPTLEASLYELAQNGHKKVVLIPISFCIDNLETLQELCIYYQEKAIKMGFDEFLVSPCLNDSENFAKFIVDLCDKE
jgi:ferrochelatase